MIVYLVSARHAYTVKDYLQDWQPALAKRIQVLTYESLPQMSSLPSATYIFSDIEPLGPAATELAVSVWETLAHSGEAIGLYNNPSKAMRRYELLRLLSKSGRNRFEVRRPSDGLKGLRFPVFVRNERNHRGPSTRLLLDMTELRQALMVQRLRMVPTRELLIEEFCDTAAEAGVYRKYSAFVVGGKIIPRHIFFSKHWVQKTPDLLSDEWAAEQMAHLQNNPHREMLAAIFHDARIDYGRIDYSLLDGQPQVWEINTNPTIIQPRSDYPALALPAQEYLAERLAEALTALDGVPEGGPQLPIHFDARLLRKVRAEYLAESRGERRHRRARRLLMAIPLVWWGKYDYQ